MKFLCVNPMLANLSAQAFSNSLSMKNYEMHRESKIDAVQPSRFKLPRNKDEIRDRAQQACSRILGKNKTNYSVHPNPLSS